MMEFNLFKKPDQPPPVSPLVNAICKSLRSQHKRWRNGGMRINGKDTHGLEHTSGTVLHLDMDAGYWEVWLPRHIPNPSEQEVLLMAVSEWGADKIEEVGDDAPTQPSPPKDDPVEEDNYFNNS